MVLMSNSRQRLVVVIGQPIYDVVKPLLSALYKALFWWADILSQRTRNAVLRDDIQANLHFLYSAATFVSEKWMRTAIHPFDYAVVRLITANILWSFARGQDQLNILLSPRHKPEDTHDFYTVIAALDGVNVDELRPIKYLSDVATLLQPRMAALNDVFSEASYSAFREKLSTVEAILNLARRQSEWEINKSIYRWH
jgi:hypothetical protein